MINLKLQDKAAGDRRSEHRRAESAEAGQGRPEQREGQRVRYDRGRETRGITIGVSFFAPRFRYPAR